MNTSTTLSVRSTLLLPTFSKPTFQVIECLQYWWVFRFRVSLVKRRDWEQCDCHCRVPRRMSLDELTIVGSRTCNKPSGSPQTSHCSRCTRSVLFPSSQRDGSNSCPQTLWNGFDQIVNRKGASFQSPILLPIIKERGRSSILSRWNGLVYRECSQLIRSSFPCKPRGEGVPFAERRIREESFRTTDCTILAGRRQTLQHHHGLWDWRSHSSARGSKFWFGERGRERKKKIEKRKGWNNA